MSYLTPPPYSDFKLLHLKSYASAEWLADGKKKYRNVFEASELTFIYAEAAFHNKRFEIDAWEADLQLTCKAITLDGYYLNTICEIAHTMVAAPTERVVSMREGFGNATKGVFWAAGAYIWELFLGEELLGQHRFYVQDVGVVTSTHNPYLQAHSLKLFEGGNDLPPLMMRSYTDHFYQDTTRYIWGEFTFMNLVHDRDWMCELTLRFFNAARELKGINTEITIVTKEDNVVFICSAWGSEALGTWYPGEFTIEIVFMEQLMGVFRFEISAEKGKSAGGWLSNWKPVNWLRGKNKKST